MLTYLIPRPLGLLRYGYIFRPSQIAERLKGKRKGEREKTAKTGKNMLLSLLSVH